MLLQLYNYLAIKAAQKPCYGLSRGLGRPGQKPRAHSCSSLKTSLSFQLRRPRHLIILNYHIIGRKSFEWHLKFLKQESLRWKVWDLVAAPGCMFRICFSIVGDLSLTLFSQEGVADMLKNAQRCITRTCVIPYTLIILAMTSETSSHFSMLWTEHGGSRLK